MATHIDDEEQLENLKRWWRENWVALAAGLGIGIAVIGGWEGYKRWRDGRAETASQMYEDMKKALAASKTDEAGQIVERLTSGYGSTPYAAVASLRAAQAAVERGELDAAVAHLSWVAQHADDEGMVQLARLRKARVLFAQGKHDEALAALSGEAGSFASLYEELRGDVLLAKGDRPGARGAYEKALTAAGETAANRNLLEQKLDDLAVASSS